MSESATVRVRGRVQGVGYRYFAHQSAVALGLTGWVCNRPDRSVEVEIQGSRTQIESYLEKLRQGPPLGHVDEVDVTWHPTHAPYARFEIKP